MGEPKGVPLAWDHDIFASSVWYLDDRLPGTNRWTHSPFRLDCHAALREWGQVMDYFQFPAVRLFQSVAELLQIVAQSELLGSMVVAMRDFNAATLRATDRQWQTVLRLAALRGRKE